MNSLIASEFTLKQNWVPIKESSRDWKKRHLLPVLEACSKHFEPLRPPLEFVLAAGYEREVVDKSRLEADKAGVVVVVTLHWSKNDSKMQLIWKLTLEGTLYIPHFFSFSITVRSSIKMSPFLKFFLSFISNIDNLWMT